MKTESGYSLRAHFLSASKSKQERAHQNGARASFLEGRGYPPPPPAPTFNLRGSKKGEKKSLGPHPRHSSSVPDCRRTINIKCSDKVAVVRWSTRTATPSLGEAACSLQQTRSPGGKTNKLRVRIDTGGLQGK